MNNEPDEQEMTTWRAELRQAILTPSDLDEHYALRCLRGAMRTVATVEL